MQWTHGFTERGGLMGTKSYNTHTHSLRCQLIPISFAPNIIVMFLWYQPKSIIRVDGTQYIPFKKHMWLYLMQKTHVLIDIFHVYVCKIRVMLHSLLDFNSLRDNI